MKKKPPTEPIIAPEILHLAKRSAKRSTDSKRPKIIKPCSVCGGVRTPPNVKVSAGKEASGSGEDDNLCWVCRRLKISAWGESEQLSVSE